MTKQTTKFNLPKGIFIVDSKTKDSAKNTLEIIETLPTEGICLEHLEKYAGRTLRFARPAEIFKSLEKNKRVKLSRWNWSRRSESAHQDQSLPIEFHLCWF